MYDMEEVKMKFCGNCGTQLNDDAIFCANCGAKIGVVSGSANTTEPAEAATPVTQEGNAVTQENEAASEAGNPQGVNPQALNPGMNPQALNPGMNPQVSNPGMNPQMANQGYANPYPGGNMPQQPPKKPMSKKTLGIIIGAAAAVLVLIIAVVIAKNIKKTINVNDYISVEFTGYDTVGKAEVKVDYDGLAEAVLEAQGKKLKQKDVDDYTWADLLDLLSWENYALVDSVEPVLDQSEGLSNGDKVTVSITYDESAQKDAGVKLKVSDQQFTVEGLADVQEVDPFAELDVTYDGIAPNVRVYLQNNATDDVLYYVGYEIEDEKDYYTEGDTFTVKVSDYDIEYALDQGYRFTQTEKEYTVDAVDKYVLNLSDLSDEELAQIQAEAQDTVDAYIADYSENVVAKDTQYVGAYLLTAKDPDSWGTQNYLYLVYSATLSAKDKDFKKTTVYYPVEFYSLIKTADGTLDFDDYGIVGYNTLLDADGDYSWYSTKGYTDGEEMYNDIVTSNRDDYKYEMSEALQEFGN